MSLPEKLFYRFLMFFNSSNRKYQYKFTIICVFHNVTIIKQPLACEKRITVGKEIDLPQKI